MGDKVWADHRRWHQLGITHEQFSAVAATFTPKTPNNVIEWWFFGDHPPPSTLTIEMWGELLKPFHPVAVQ